MRLTPARTRLCSWALLLATTLLLVDGVRRLRARAVVLLSLPLGAWGVHVDHIFSPTGAAGMLLIAVGTAAAVWWSDPAPRARHAA